LEKVKFEDMSMLFDIYNNLWLGFVYRLRLLGGWVLRGCGPSPFLLLSFISFL
jgi:hypothetical protein